MNRFLSAVCSASMAALKTPGGGFAIQTTKQTSTQANSNTTNRTNRTSCVERSKTDLKFAFHKPLSETDFVRLKIKMSAFVRFAPAAKVAAVLF